MLDELSNIETWGGLRNAITQGGGNGYQLLVVEQSRDMMVRDYDRETEQTVWNNCNRIMLGRRHRPGQPRMVGHADRPA